MPLTPAEKMKRYREKLKKDPQKYEEYKKKDLLRVQTNKKKISELSEEDKEKRRKKWREDKKNQKKKRLETEAKKHQRQTPKQPKTTLKSTKKKLINTRRLINMYNAVVKQKKIIKKALCKTRRRYYRLMQQSSMRIQTLEDQIMKHQARDEVMECALRSAYKKCKTHKEKHLLKHLAFNEMVRKNKAATHIGKLLGLQGRVRLIRKEGKLQKSIKVRKEIEIFFLRDDISRNTAGKRECRTLNKKRYQIRYLTDSLCNLHKLYKEEGGKYSLTTFFKYKPMYILSPSIKNRETCMCIKHSNTEMIFLALKKSGVIADVKSLTDAIENLSCDLKSYKCMYGVCLTCKRQKLNYKLEGNLLNKRIQWNQWERVDHIYNKSEKGEIKQLVTKKTVKKCRESTVRELIQIFENKVPAFKIHYFNWKHQQNKYREKINKMEQTEVLILCDFSENYDCKSGKEVQATHFGASKQNITLHCGMIYWENASQSFCTISDDKCHEPAAIWAHLMPILDIIKVVSPQVTTIHFFSDGPTSQYRQKKNFFLLNLFTTKLKLNFCTWNFSESGHGKGVADGIGGAVKRALDKQVAYGRDITNGTEAYEILKSTMKSVKCFFVQESEINHVAQLIPNDLRPVPGTIKIHQVITHPDLPQIQHRILTCFCDLKKNQLCKCFTLKTHTFYNSSSNEKSTKLNTSLPTRNQAIKETSENTLPGLIRDNNGLDKVNNFKMGFFTVTDSAVLPTDTIKQNNAKNIVNLHNETNIATSSTSSTGQHNLNSIIINLHDEIECGSPPTGFIRQDSVDNMIVNLHNETNNAISSISSTGQHNLNNEIINLHDEIECGSPPTGSIRQDSVNNMIVNLHNETNGVISSTSSTGQHSVNNTILKLHNETVYAMPSTSSPGQDSLSTVHDYNTFCDAQNLDILNSEIECYINSSEQEDFASRLINDMNFSVESVDFHDSHSSARYGKEPQIKKRRTTCNEKENVTCVKNKNPSIRISVSRDLKCFLCKKMVPFSSRDIVKCIACKKYYCITCSDGQNAFDYICMACFGV